MAAAASLMPRLASLAGPFDAGASTRAAALGALEAAAVRFGDVFVVSENLASNAKIAALSQTR